MNWSWLRADERGSITVELAILTPVLILLLGALVLAGRIQTSASSVEQAARSAARDASLARTPDAARAAAVAAAARELATTACAATTVDVDTSGFSTRIGQDGIVTATVSCTVSIADLAVPGLPGARTITAQATSPLDRYRTR
ncbi:pilus assembly protein TadE [Cellulomonas humilata]|uniref:Pilus assembly protein TadE n=1 Tax=Cellulomonas humilata TaxID=144055 RepID=A0A7Y6DW37_9CELL|nr:TadE/TadG family type IV pilus assembly protein [Cellulomonas humilata]NUU15820.1 pilus assembly protein TadE [Cellulomonas humilata]